MSADLSRASHLYLPKLGTPPQTVFDYLLQRFPHIPAASWEERMAKGRVISDDGTALEVDTPYRQGVTVYYWKEVAGEAEPRDIEQILYRDDNILVADKPRGMQVTPAGNQVGSSLLARLKQSTGLAFLSPAHRIDRETAGVVLLTVRSEIRGLYQRLFDSNRIEKEYLALAHVEQTPAQTQWRVENRLEMGTPWYRRQVVEGEVNAVTSVELIELRERVGLFRLRPETGKKHQLRVHMALLGFPIIGDPLYPEVRLEEDNDPHLQLVAHRLVFTDPINGEERTFISKHPVQ